LVQFKGRVEPDRAPAGEGRKPVGCVELAMTHRPASRCVFATHPTCLSFLSSFDPLSESTAFLAATAVPAAASSIPRPAVQQPAHAFMTAKPVRTVVTGSKAKTTSILIPPRDQRASRKVSPPCRSYAVDLDALVGLRSSFSSNVQSSFSFLRHLSIRHIFQPIGSDSKSF
jgi:hypothetical protein